MRLLAKMLLALLLVVLLGGVTVAFLANQAAEREVRGFMFGNSLTTEAALAQELAGYYRGHGGWEAVQLVLPEPGHGMGHMQPQRLLVADARNVIVADTAAARLQDTLSPAEVAQGYAIQVDQARVGTLVVLGPIEGMDGPGNGRGSTVDLLGRMNRAIWLAALAAGAGALIVGGVLAYNLTRPIQRLTVATQAVARGDLEHRVPVTSRDEIGDLAEAFNTMTANLQQAERLRRDLTADIAHELRNPLAVLQGNLEGLLDGVLPPTEDNLRPLLDQTLLLSRLVDDLRMLALAEAGQLHLDQAPTDVATLVRAVAARFAAQAEGKHIQLNVQADTDLPLAILDAQRIEQVLGNLLSNALRYTPAQGCIDCVVQPIEPVSGVSSIRVTVTDSGPGVPAEALPHLFDRFYRVDKSRSRVAGGSGLGLAIAKQLIEAHGGTITAENRPPLGLHIEFTLPVR